LLGFAVFLIDRESEQRGTKGERKS
jgi:hypothetical protein